MNIETAKDTNLLVERAISWTKGFGSSINGVRLKEDLDDLKETGAVFICKDKDRDLGFIAGKLISPFWATGDVALEHCVMVHPEYRSQGIATTLVAAFASWGKMAGATEIFICPTDAWNVNIESAMSSLKDKGFSLSGYYMRRGI
jgi:GNAT superfamily N-acetyltransferase